MSVKQQKPGGEYGTHTWLGVQYGQKIQTSPKWLEWGDAQMSGSGTHCNNNCAAISATLRNYTKDLYALGRGPILTSNNKMRNTPNLRYKGL